MKLSSVETTDGIVDGDTAFLCNFEAEAPLLQAGTINNQCSGHGMYGRLSFTTYNFKLKTICGRRSSGDDIQKYSLFLCQQGGIHQQQQQLVTCDM